MASNWTSKQDRPFSEVLVATLKDGGLATLNERLRLLYGGLLMGQQSSAEN